MDLSEIRRNNQLEFLNSGAELQIGNVKDLPLPLEVVRNINVDSPYVKKCLSSGLTAIVYQIEVDGKQYAVKKVRDNILVKNTDGQTSFLNELQRRKDFELFRENNKIIDNGINKTIYGSLLHGVIVTDWINGNHIDVYNRNILRNMFQLLNQIHFCGIFEWDLCPGNIMLDAKENVILFDFGYSYKFNPLKMYHSNGKENPLFHSIERFETRAFMQYLLDFEKKNGHEMSIELFRIEKEEAVNAYNDRLVWLKQNDADADIIETFLHIIETWENALLSDKNLEELYDLERFRSYVLDIYDDISGESCTPGTIILIDEVISLINDKHDFLRENDAYLWEDKKADKQQLLKKFTEMLQKAKDLQVKK
ncbi:MAG: AarF/UbiB family protein [Bacillota bacterium]|nr:AarF/UbiB family protein [Bacillota bacterium]